MCEIISDCCRRGSNRGWGETVCPLRLPRGATFSGLVLHIQDQGRSMPSYREPAPPRTQFSILYRSLLQSDELPLRSLISYSATGSDFRSSKGIPFGQEEDAVYTPAVTLWGLLSQVLFKEEQGKSLAAVVRIAALWLGVGAQRSPAPTPALTAEPANKSPAKCWPRSAARLPHGPSMAEAKRPPPDAGIGPASGEG